LWLDRRGVWVKFHSQVGQDRFLLENFFRGKRGGVFVDIGAYDGETFSNSAFFERTMGWTGLCVEPLPSAFERLRASRKAICEQVCVADFEGEAEFTEADDPGRNEKMLSGLTAQFDARHRRFMQQLSVAQTMRTVPVTRLSKLLEKHGLFDIDYCSIDTEGAELPILSELDFERFRVSVLTVEDNSFDERIPRLMAAKGYDVFARLEQDIVFKRRDVKALPRTSVFCAVWHRDPNRIELLRGHAANLARQTVPVEPIYVFDGGDKPPSWLEGRAVSVREPLSIYQAWNVALSLVATPLAMNLNLDDRLAPDAVELLERHILRTGAVMLGGEWKVCYSQSETDDVAPCYPADQLPFVETWPPKPGTLTRLGSGTGERGTLGPATIWRMDAHMALPRFPWRLRDGTLLRGAGDLAWWKMLASNPNFRVVPLPIVIGNYHSHPEDQAEFRTPDERPLFNDPGVSLL
jgi:FkbM family methyltransferase